MKKLFSVLALGAAIASTNVSADAIRTSVESSHRSESFTVRDDQRHPVETLTAFQLAPSDTVVEIWPGSGWYTEILAPVLKDDGRLIAAHFPADTEINYYTTSRMNFVEKLAENSEVYGKVELAQMVPNQGVVGVEEMSVDKVLTFRNVHNWLRGGNEQTVLNSFYSVLKPGGLLGIVEHRANEGATREEMLRSGYVTQSYVIQIAEAAGFELVEAFEINANELDTKDYDGGVWSLPPTLRHGDQDREKYTAIGESDRMTLLFRRPE
ncbi:methyltransferase [uncultured Umboniibacter sp.]|uniref:class I SAM-dependent methyltransferase n=1 Tax=uncultured Umboniibacter sp. TaxID=1798917 RepID=UPI00262B1CE2|nr:methyltransferase [uncultured Umboniibacter sp.]